MASTTSERSEWKSSNLKLRIHVRHLLAQTTLFVDAFTIVKPERCTCSLGQVLHQERYDNVPEYAH